MVPVRDDNRDRATPMCRRRRGPPGRTQADVELIEEVKSDEGVRWLFSFLSADRRRTYCLYEAPSPDAILAPPVRQTSRPMSSSR